MKIDFSFETKYGRFGDALHLPDDHGLTDDEIEAMKQQRLTNWLAIIENPGEPVNLDIVVGYHPTPDKILSKLLQAANFSSSDVLYDLGCGDGNVIINAATNYGCKCVGFDLSEQRINNSKENIAKANVQDKVSVKLANVFEQDFSAATVIYVWLTQSAVIDLETKLFSLKTGTKIITYEHLFSSHTPNYVVTDNDNIGYIWIVG